MSLSTQTYLLTLYVTYQQESAIRDLFSSNGWLFRIKGDRTELEDQLNNAVKESTVTAFTDSDYKIEYNADDSPHGNYEFESIRESNDSNERGDVADSEQLMPGIEIKVETTVDDVDFIGHRGTESLSEENSAVTNPTPKRKRKDQKASLKKNRNEKRGQILPVKNHLSASASVLEKGVSRKKSADKTQVQQKQGNDSENKTSASQNSNLDVDLGVDPERIALEIELQETEDIDHYETVHKSLTPDEPFNPPSDVQEPNGFSPSLGCYYCHDCGYTFQLLRWYKIHKWNGKCVYKCSVCSQVFTFRNISSYRTHMMKHKSSVEEVVPIGETFHELKKKEKKEHKCEQCDFVSHFKHSMLRHKRVKHLQLVETHFCPDCEKTFGSSSALKVHFSSTHSDQGGKYNCLYCDKRFMNKTYFSGHLNQHLGLREKCICGASFTFPTDLTRHKKQCKGFTPPAATYDCTVCDKRFRKRHELKEHVMGRHEHRSQYVCVCGKAFKWRSSLKSHRDRCHMAYLNKTEQHC